MPTPTRYCHKGPRAGRHIVASLHVGPIGLDPKLVSRHANRTTLTYVAYSPVGPVRPDTDLNQCLASAHASRTAHVTNGILCTSHEALSHSKADGTHTCVHTLSSDAARPPPIMRLSSGHRSTVKSSQCSRSYTSLGLNRRKNEVKTSFFLPSTTGHQPNVTTH
jgi:hypothetical protein